MQDRPTIDELLDAVEIFLRETAVDRLEGQPKFHARVAANAVSIVRRELALEAQMGDAEAERLGTLTTLSGSRQEMNEQIAGSIRDGGAIDSTAVLEHLRQTAREKLAVANPNYRAEQ